MQNDQVEIIQYIIEKKYHHVWERVKFIGIKDVSDINERYLIFMKAAHSFKPEINNNFIHFYKKYLRGLRLDKNETFLLTNTPSVIRELKNEIISPSLTKSKRKAMADPLKKWDNQLGEE